MPTPPRKTSAPIERGRATFVRAFGAYLRSDPARAAQPMSVRKLAEAIADDPRARSAGLWAPSSAGKNFSGPKEFVWDELCARLILLDPNFDYPEEVTFRARMHWKRTDDPAAPRRSYDPSQFDNAETWPDEHLLAAVTGSNDTEYAVACASALATRLHGALLEDRASSTTGTADGTETAAEPAERARSHANALYKLANTTVGVLDACRTPIPDSTRRHCIPIFEAASDAHRLLSRVPGEEALWMTDLAELRRRDLHYTACVRSPADQLMTRYWSNAAAALTADQRDRSCDSSFAAISTAISELSALAPDELVDCSDGLRAISARLAGLALAYPNRAPEMVEIAASLNKVIIAAPDSEKPGTEPWHLRAEARTLLQQAGLVPSTRAEDGRIGTLRPSRLLSLARYRGIGELLIARALVQMADDPHPRSRINVGATEHTDWLEPYLGPWQQPIDKFDPVLPEDPATLKARAPFRRLLLQSARGYYRRAENWFHGIGAAGILGRSAAEEGTALDTRLADMEDPEPASKDQVPPVAGTDDLYMRIECVVAEAIILFGAQHSSAQEGDPAAVFASISITPMIVTLSHAVAVLQRPFGMSLRSDLAAATMRLRPHPSR